MVHHSPSALCDQNPIINRKLDGKVERGETYVGSKGKTVVLTIVERNDELRTGVTPNLNAKSVQTVIRDNVKAGVNMITDEHSYFVGLAKDFNHYRVDHPTGEDVHHNILHTNGTESIYIVQAPDNRDVPFSVT